MLTFPLIDIGLNLASHRFTHDWKEVIARAHDAGVARFILTGTSLKTSKEVALLTEKMAPGSAYFTAGIHPHYASGFGADALAQLRALLSHPNAVAVGETGLDYNRDLSPRPVQRAALEAQVDLACTVGKPLFLHEREAAPDLLAILDNFKDRLPNCVVHCFTGSETVARQYVERGFYLGITGWVGQKNRNRDLLRALEVIPPERMMLETDAPYLTPPGYAPHIAGRNEPAALPRVAELLAIGRGVPVEQVRADAYAATMAFFGLDDPHQAAG
ncbi:TatD family hydrolase [Massilia antarctica]|uniref:TatD family hydrolase n=1 Tax=Massilia antarctica TaxID=2765360 RepID=UPI0006BB7F0A|nr:TatD family hydrolase [Massilia sp. H27-R4]MCY0914523.1 TatD family hydrolase [Massilia sp. H27-R4]CUI03085.1 Deoxyribonuclease TatD [Janthinobacterium sp. CG23_2]CUU26871.1 Deoxyribonuclease TatD [Janthinobacterium sp. CG23_2]